MARIIKSYDFKEMPWKNGGGTTREIFRIPHSEHPDQFHFRISLASVHQSGPFSKFPGIQRFLMLLSGNGFILNNKIKFQKPMDQLEFSGSEEYFCELINGSCTDFNVMTDEAWGKSKIRVSELKKNHSQDYQATYLFIHGSQTEFIILEPQEIYHLEASDDLIIVEIEVIREVG